MLFVVFLSELFVSLFVLFFRLGHPCYSHPLSQAGHFVSPGNRSVLSLSLAITMNKNQSFYAQPRVFSLFFLSRNSALKIRGTRDSLCKCWKSDF